MLRADSAVPGGPQEPMLRDVPLPAAAGAEPMGSAKMAIRIRHSGDASRFEGSLQESGRSVRQTGTDANVGHAASSDGLVLSDRSSPGPGRSAVFQA